MLLFQKPRKLSGVQERKLLKRLESCKPIDCGSSRLVFIDPRNRQRVIKVAVGAFSLRQNKMELRMWNSHGRSGNLARIFEYGRYVVVMERCERTYDSDSVYDLSEEIRDEIEAVAGWLESLLTESEDNYQVGRTFDGRWVSYDYGFDPEIDSDVQCGHAQRLGYGRDKVDYLQTIRRILVAKKPSTYCEAYFD